MAGLLYFLPDVYTQQLVRGDALSVALLRERGLDEVLADRLTTDLTSVYDLRGRGPGGRCGSMIVPLPNSGSAPPRMTFEPDCQAWEPWDEDKLWIGRDLSAAPTPADLARRQCMVGYDVALADGQRWHVPVVRRWGDTTQLPRTLKFDAGGAMRAAIRPEYRELFEAMEPAIELLCGAGGEQTIDIEPFVRLAIRVLGVNYRYGLAEQNVLGLVDTTNWQAVLEAAVDLPLVEEALRRAEKKTASAAASERSSTPPGRPADSPATPPATAS